ncbi:MAG: hypothetical protein HQL95_06990 [Magnetococcales bacterium]|nr:hypothetical protein [Magnetococcales bacterium]
MSAAPRLSNRSFGLGMGVVLAGFALLEWWLHRRISWGLLAGGGVLAVLAWSVPWVLMPFNRLWGRLAWRLGEVNNALLLGLLFYILITPVGWLARLFRHDPLGLKFLPESATYLTPVFRQTDADTVRDLF